MISKITKFKNDNQYNYKLKIITKFKNDNKYNYKLKIITKITKFENITTTNIIINYK